MNKTRPLIREYKKGPLQLLLICKAEDLNQNQRNADKETMRVFKSRSICLEVTVLNHVNKRGEGGDRWGTYEKLTIRH
jgi:hypothetical protein